MINIIFWIVIAIVAMLVVYYTAQWAPKMFVQFVLYAFGLWALFCVITVYTYSTDGIKSITTSTDLVMFFTFSGAIIFFGAWGLYVIMCGLFGGLGAISDSIKDANQNIKYGGNYTNHPRYQGTPRESSAEPTEIIQTEADRRKQSFTIEKE